MWGITFNLNYPQIYSTGLLLYHQNGHLKKCYANRSYTRRNNSKIGIDDIKIGGEIIQSVFVFNVEIGCGKFEIIM